MLGGGKTSTRHGTDTTGVVTPWPFSFITRKSLRVIESGSVGGGGGGGEVLVNPTFY